LIHTQSNDSESSLQQFTFLEPQSPTMWNRITESNEFDSVEQNTRDGWFSSRSHLTLRIS